MRERLSVLCMYRERTELRGLSLRVNCTAVKSEGRKRQDLRKKMLELPQCLSTHSLYIILFTQA
jgi:hypothetical protein